MDVSKYTEVKPAPRAVFDALPERKSRTRFMVPKPGGGYRAVTWEQFAEAIRRCALFLSSAGLKPGDRAVVFAPNSVEWLSAALAIQAAGGVMVPIYAGSTAEQAAYVVSHSDAKVLFVGGQAPLARVLEEWPACAQVLRIVSFDDARPGPLLERLITQGKASPPAPELHEKLVTWSWSQDLGAQRDAREPRAFERLLEAVTLDQVGLMLYTSGTSGNPKGVPLTHRNVGVNGLDWLKANAPLLNGDDSDVLWLPMSHIFGFGEACLGNTLGFTSWLSDPATALERLSEVKPNVFMSVPAYWEKLATAALRETTVEGRKAALAEATGGRLTLCLSGGAGLKREVKEVFHQAGLLIVEGYGLTETSPTLTLNTQAAFRFDAVGKPLPTVELKLADDGEILARGPNVFAGYHKDPDATREAFTADGWFKTGDVGRFTDDGFLQIIDRKKDILVTAGGKNVPPANIELKFRDDPFIAHLVVYGDGQRYLVAGVWLHEAALKAHPTPEARAALVQPRIDAVNAQLAGHETLKRFHLFDGALSIEGGTLTSTLKVRRKQVYQAFKKELEALYT